MVFMSTVSILGGPVVHVLSSTSLKDLIIVKSHYECDIIFVITEVEVELRLRVIIMISHE